jgi:hypothetical protein
MALSSAIVWEVRTTGADTNGGGYKTGASGTDFSQQAAAQYALTGLTTAAADAIILSASAATDMVGNVIKITSGTNFIVGFYEIISVVAGVSMTVDRNCTNAAGVGGVGNVGGAFASPGLLYNCIVSGNIMYWKYNASVYTASSTTPGASNSIISIPPSLSDFALIGYDTTRTLSNTDANRPTLKASGISSTSLLVHGNSIGSVLYRNFIIDGDSLTNVDGIYTASGYRILGERITVKNCRYGFGTIPFRFYKCLADNCTRGFDDTFAVGCESYGCVTGFYLSETIDCIAAECSGVGFSLDGFGTTCSHCTAYDCTDGFDANSYPNECISCIAYGNSGYGFDGTRGLIACAAGSNTSGNTSTGATHNFQIPTLIALTADPFVNAASRDFSLNNTAGGGALCRAAGMLGAFFGGTTTGYRDIGAVQHADPTAAVDPIAHVVSASAAGSGSSATTSSVNTTGATLLIVALASGVLGTVSDNKGNTWVALTGYGATPFIQLFYARNPIVGTGHTFTGTATSQFPSIAMMAFSGAATSYPFGHLTQDGGADKTPGTITPLEDNELIVSALSDNSASTVYAIDAGMTLGPTVVFIGGTAYGVAMAYEIQTTKAANTPTWTASGANNSSTQASFRVQPRGETTRIINGFPIFG